MPEAGNDVCDGVTSPAHIRGRPALPSPAATYDEVGANVPHDFRLGTVLMTNATHPPDVRTAVAFGLAVTIGGTNFVAVRLSNQELAPFWGAGLRFASAAVLFVVLCVVLRLRWPRGRPLLMTAAYGVLGFGVAYALAYWALTRVTAGVGSIVLAAVPLVTLLLAVAQGLERLTVRAATGAVIAVAGIAWMAGGPGHGDVPAAALAALVLATLAVAMSFVLSKQLAGNHPAMTNAVGMTVGALLLLALSAATGERWALPRETNVVWAVIYLVTLGSVGLFALVLMVVRRWTASATSYALVLAPVATAIVGAVVADEHLSPYTAAGGALVMAGAWLGAFSARGDRVTDRGRRRRVTTRSTSTR